MTIQDTEITVSPAEWETLRPQILAVAKVTASARMARVTVRMQGTREELATIEPVPGLW